MRGWLSIMRGPLGVFVGTPQRISRLARLRVRGAKLVATV
jgi:hypothetical protein